MILLEYMCSFLRIVYKIRYPRMRNPRVDEWVYEVRCRLSTKSIVVGLQFYTETATWFDTEFVDEVRDRLDRKFGMYGTVLGLLSEPMGKSGAQLFSAVVHEIGVEVPVSMWTLGRM